MHSQWSPTAFYELRGQAAHRNAQLRLMLSGEELQLKTSSHYQISSCLQQGWREETCTSASAASGHNLASWYNPIFTSNLTRKTQLQNARQKAQVHAPFCQLGREWRRAAGQSSTASATRAGLEGAGPSEQMPSHTRAKHACLLWLHFLHGFGLLSTEQWCWLPVSYPQRSLRISLHSIISSGCDSSFNSRAITIPAQKSPDRIAGTSAASALRCQGERCCPQAVRTGASPLRPGWCGRSTSCTANPPPWQPGGDPALLRASSLPAAARVFTTVKNGIHKKPLLTCLFL